MVQRRVTQQGFDASLDIQSHAFENSFFASFPIPHSIHKQTLPSSNVMQDSTASPRSQKACSTHFIAHAMNEPNHTHSNQQTKHCKEREPHKAQSCLVTSSESLRSCVPQNCL